MKLSSNQLEAFYAVARTRNFTKAADLIHVTQSALSQRILNLENEIETTLFIRDRSGIELTEAAKDLFRYCQLQESFENEFFGSLKSKNRNELVGTIRIAGYSSVMRSAVLPALKDTLLKHPQVHLQTYTRELHELLPMLKRGEVNFIILDHKLDREEIESIDLGVERNVLAEAEDYDGPDIYLDHDELDETTSRYLKLRRKGIKKIHRHFLDDIYGILDGVKLGLGRAVVPEHLISKNDKIVIKNKNLSLETPVIAHFYRQAFYTPLHEEIVSALSKNVTRFLRTNK